MFATPYYENVSAQGLNGYQLRTDVTKARLLAAAEEVFVRDGYEGAELGNIAKQAGRTKGSIYAHYSSKAELFLALYEDRTRRQFEKLAGLLKGSRTQADAMRRYKAFLTEVVKDKTWPLLTLEFKLYSVRHPEGRDRWNRSYEMVRSLGKELLEADLLRGLSSAKRKRLDLQMAAIAPLLSSLALETYFEPRLSSEKNLIELLNLAVSPLLEVS